MRLALASIAVFIAYVTLTIRGMRIAYAISTVAIETRSALRRMSPAEEHYIDVELPPLGSSRRIVYYSKGPSPFALHAAQGVLQALDIGACVKLAVQHV